MSTHTAASDAALSTTEQLAQRLGLGTVTIKRLVKRGELNCLRFNRNVIRFEETEIQRFLASKKG